MYRVEYSVYLYNISDLDFVPPFAQKAAASAQYVYAYCTRHILFCFCFFYSCEGEGGGAERGGEGSDPGLGNIKIIHYHGMCIYICT